MQYYMTQIVDTESRELALRLTFKATGVPRTGKSVGEPMVSIRFFTPLASPSYVTFCANNGRYKAIRLRN